MIAPDKPKMFRKKRRPANVPEYLVYEIIDGKPYYYKGYRGVLAKTKTLEEITGRGVYLWVITEYLLRTLFAMPGKNKYHIATGRPVILRSIWRRKGLRWESDLAISLSKAIFASSKISPQ